MFSKKKECYLGKCEVCIFCILELDKSEFLYCEVHEKEIFNPKQAGCKEVIEKPLEYIRLVS